MLVMFMQFKVVKQTDIMAIENMRESQLRGELSDWNQKYEELNERYQEVLAKISEYKNESESDEKTAQLLETELAQINEALGKTDVEGEGIMITITDNGGQELSEGVIVDSINEEDILLIINALFDAGAEAVSINEQRIVAMSDIVLIGGEFLRVNGERILPDYVIKAIGDQTYLESSVLGKGGPVDALKELGHEATLSNSKKIKIEKYKGTISTKYLQ